MPKLNLFLPIIKVDAAQRLVYGVATAEQPDKSGEVCDYASTVPYYKAWSAEFEKNTDGKSLGNVRAMHGSIAAGVVKQINFNDDAKQIEICAKIVDDAEWKKVEEGVYTGFSQGGEYVKRWRDGDYTKYTANPMEVSIVDNPCLGSATFEYIKADGAAEMRKFTTVEVPVVDEKAIGKKLAQVWATTDGTTHATKAEAVKAQARIDAEAAARAELAPAIEAAAQLEADMAKKDYSDKEREGMAGRGEAMPDGTFAIKTREDVAGAISDWGAKGSDPQVKEHIKTRAKAIGAEDALPDDWKLSERDKPESDDRNGDSPKVDTSKKSAALDELKKYIGQEVFDAAAAMDALQTLMFVLWGEEQEAASGDAGEGSQIADLKTAFESIKSFIISELQEDGSTESTDAESMEMAAEGDLEKKGARHSKTDTEHLTDIHKHASQIMDKCMALGMDKTASEGSQDGDDAMKAVAAASSEALIKAEAKSKAMGKVVGELTDTIKGLTKRLAMLEAQPAPAKGAVFAVEKGHEVQIAGKEPVEAKKEEGAIPNGVSPAEARAWTR